MKTCLENMVRTVLMASMISMAFPFASAYAAAWEDTGNGWVYVDEAGERLTGWQQDGGQWYYLDENGLMKTGWIRDDGKWYLLDSSGAMMTGTVEDEETEYQFSDAGDLTSASKKKNEGGGTFPIGFYTEIQQEFADSLNESKQDDGVHSIIQASLEPVYQEYPHQRGNISYLIHYESNRFIVFIDAEKELDWETSDEVMWWF